MAEPELSKIDLNLLVVLDVLLLERSVGAAAQRLNLTSSAVSHALRRLRELFDNELLVWDGKVMQPTARAQELARTLPVALEHVRRTFEVAEAFNPATSRRTFRLAVPDFVTPVIPCILQKKGKEAENIRVAFLPHGSSRLQDLAQGQCDVVIAHIKQKVPELSVKSLGAFPWKVFGRAGHPAFENWSSQRWLEFPHLQIQTGTNVTRGPIDDRLQSLGLERTVGATVPQFTIAAPVLKQTDYLLAVPGIAMSQAAAVYGLDCRDLPIDIPVFEVGLFRSIAFGDDPAVKWFADLVEVAFSLL